MGKSKAKTVKLGIQNFEKIRERDAFYIDKTGFLKEWWENGSDVTLITRPRRFGKTLNMSMVECFFSNKYKDRGDLFEGLSVWGEESSEEDMNFRKFQGAFPVISISFASVGTTEVTAKAGAAGMKTSIKQVIADVYNEFSFMMASKLFSENDRNYFYSVNDAMDDSVACKSIKRLSTYLEIFYGSKVIILLDEYDTPIQEAWLKGFWDEATEFFRSFFVNTFKSNESLERGLITGITRISKESIFSGLNHIDVVSITSNEYALYFGFTEEEVFQALDDAGLGNHKEGVKQWYDGFTFGKYTDIYNPWSITSFIRKEGKYEPYWANTSSNSLVSKLLQKGDATAKQEMEELLLGRSFTVSIDEQIVFNQLNESVSADRKSVV